MSFDRELLFAVILKDRTILHVAVGEFAELLERHRRSIQPVAVRGIEPLDQELAFSQQNRLERQLRRPDVHARILPARIVLEGRRLSIDQASFGLGRQKDAQFVLSGSVVKGDHGTSLSCRGLPTLRRNP